MQKAQVDRGRVFAKSRKLHALKCLSVPDSDPIVEPAAVAQEAARVFADRWGSNNMQALDTARDFLTASEYAPPDLDVNLMQRAFRALRRKNRLDCDGFCISLFETIFEANPDIFIAWIMHMVASSTFMSSLCASCSGFACGSSHERSIMYC